jgi:hypothetical protein
MEPKTPIQRITNKQGIYPYQSPHLKDANFIRQIANSKRNESKKRTKTLFLHIFGFLFYFFMLNLSYTR